MAAEGDRYGKGKEVIGGRYGDIGETYGEVGLLLMTGGLLTASDYNFPVVQDNLNKYRKYGQGLCGS